MYNNIFDVYYDKRLKIYLKKVNNGKNVGKLGVKKCIITEKFKNPEKYGLTIGQKFESTNELVEYTNKNRMTISRWKNKGWIL